MLYKAGAMNVRIRYRMYGDAQRSPTINAVFMCMMNCCASKVFIILTEKSSILVPVNAPILLKSLYVMNELFDGAKMKSNRKSLNIKATIPHSKPAQIIFISADRSSSKWSQKERLSFSLIVTYLSPPFGYLFYYLRHPQYRSFHL